VADAQVCLSCANMTSLKSILLLLAGGQGFFLSLSLMLVGFKKRNATIFLGVVLSVCAIELLNAYGMSINYHSNKHVFPFWILGSYLLLPPALWLFLRYNASLVFGFKPRHFILFLPAFVEILTEFISFYGSSAYALYFTFLKSYGWIFFTEYLPILWMIGTLVIHSTHVFARRKELPQRVVYKQYLFLVNFSLLTLLWLADGIFHLPVYAVIQFILCLFLFIMGYIVYYQPDFFEMPVVPKSKNYDDVFGNYKEEDVLAKLTQSMEVDKLFLKPRLTLVELAEHLGLPPRLLSYVINNRYQVNVTTWLNQYRVEEVLLRLQDPKQKHKTILGIALECGFNSKSSFNQIFKTIKGKTPSEYLNKE